MRLIACLFALVMASGCALTEDQIPVNYRAPANLSVAKGASEVTVSVTSKDDRASNKDRVSSKKNGYGMEMAPIKAQNDVVVLTQQAVEKELESLGFKIGGNGLKVNVDVQTFYNDFKIGFFAGDAVAEVAFSLTVTRMDGSYVYAKSYKGIGMNKNVQLASGSNAKAALEEALTNAMEQVIADATLQQAMISTVTAPRMSEAPQPKPGS
jgi:uncharacterized lipoprotein YajG